MLPGSILLVLGEPVAERFPCWRKLAELVTDHFFSHCQRDVMFAVVYQELESEVSWQLSDQIAVVRRGGSCQRFCQGVAFRRSCFLVDQDLPYKVWQDGATSGVCANGGVVLERFRQIWECDKERT